MWQYVLLGAVGVFLLGLLLGLGMWCGCMFWQARADRKNIKLWQEHEDRRKEP